MNSLKNFLVVNILVMTLLLMSCSKDEKAIINCNLSDPTEELSWLKASIEEIEQSDDEMSEYTYFMTAKYKGETVFYMGYCHPLINYASELINCNGDGLGNVNDFYDQLTEIKLLWKHEESVCSFD